MSAQTVFFVLAVFLVAGIAEIGGGYLVWQWLREGRALWLGVVGAVVLASYGAIATLQPTHFSRAYAAYGGVFIVLSLLWGWIFDGARPDLPDLLGATLCIAGMGVMMFAPRG